MHKIQYMAIVDEFKTRADLMRENDMPGWSSRYMGDVVEMLTEPMPTDADEMIERATIVSRFARDAMIRMRTLYAISGDEELRDRAEILCAISFGLAMGRNVALALIGVEEL